MAEAAVVLDINVVVQAVLAGKSTFETWPALPPKTRNPAADCIGVMNDCREFAPWLSPHILTNAARVLAEAAVDAAVVQEYVEILTEIADESGGGVLDPPRTVFDCNDYEDNLILDLAADVGAIMIVSDDTDLTAMSPWRATPLLRPAEFASRVDATRRARRR
jgi:predicted nucleic acid-binding protein